MGAPAASVRAKVEESSRGMRRMGRPRMTMDPSRLASPPTCKRRFRLGSLDWTLPGGGVDRLVIEGGLALSGRIRVGGAKNAALPCIAAGLLADGPVKLSGLPAVSDIRTMLKVLEGLGCAVERT